MQCTYRDVSLARNKQDVQLHRNIPPDQVDKTSVVGLSRQVRTKSYPWIFEAKKT
jgi:hypothetical protein